MNVNGNNLVIFRAIMNQYINGINVAKNYCPIIYTTYFQPLIECV